MRKPRIIAIDWSGAVRGQKKKIWLAEAHAGELVRLANGRDRAEIVQYLVDEAAKTRDLIVGFDFAFSLPAWFLLDAGLKSAAELWALAAQRGEDWLSSCDPPFWGRPGRPRPDLPAHFRQTEEQVQNRFGIQPKSAFQIGGAGAVGTGSIRGMPILAQLSRAGFAIWPFDSISTPLVVEIYPRVLTGPVVKSKSDARWEYLSSRYPHLQPGWMEVAASSEDAFDAAVSALVMEAHAEALVQLPDAESEQQRLEGLIWHPG